MALWDDISNMFSGGGRNDVREGYRDADRYLDPFRRGGMEDFNRFRDANNRMGDDLSKYGNPADWMYKHINMSPNAYYDEIMKGYSESPEAKYAQEQALKASGAGASMSGMLGSGAFMKGLQENANGISQRDRSGYFDRVMGANNQQMGYLQNFQNQKQNYMNNLYSSGAMGYGAAGQMGQNAINRGNAFANLDRQSIMDLMSMFGMGAGGGMFGKGGGGFNQGIPPYMQKSIYGG